VTLADVPRPEADELVVVVGPTASGKTELALRLAERWGGEIIGADSVQVYRAFDVGTGKPGLEERARAPHHLIDCVDPNEPIDAERFARLADQAIAEIRARGRTPIVCGGAFLWVRALTLGLAPAPPADAAIRERHAEIAARTGRAALHAQLAEIDPRSAARLDPNDFIRVSRALEVHELTGRPLSAWHEEHGFRAVRHRHRLLGVRRDRAELDERIRQRAAGWLANGWLDEVRQLRDRGYGAARPMGSVGYRQITDHLEGRLDATELLDAIVRATRVFARRQRTWIRDEPITWLERTDEGVGADPKPLAF
jgi:tRNA dimethylallyltransferase